MLKKILVNILFLSLNFAIYSQEVQISYSADENYILTERTDLRRYDNGKYKGLVSREVKSYIIPEKNNNNELIYEGYFYVNQDTKRALSSINSGIHDAIISSFKITSEGDFTMIKDCGYPSFRSFPSYPEKKVQPGDTWTNYFIRSVDPLEKNKPTKIKANVVYEFKGEKIYRNEEVYIINAQWATRYNKFSDDADLDGDDTLISATGKHSAEILVSKVNGRAVLIRDTVDEIFQYSDGNKIGFKGNIAMFTEYPPEIEKNIVENPPVFEDEKIKYEVISSGIKISLFELNFLPDSSVLIEDDKVKIKLIADYLKNFENNKILIEGHTARAGLTDNDEELSLERAHAILDELTKYGLNKNNFICNGCGSSKPIVDNDTEEGRAKNRRVEITVLGNIN